MREALEQYKGGFKIGGRRVSNLRYADDIVLVATSSEELQELIQRMVDAGKNYGLIFNKGKTKVLTTDGSEIEIYVEGVVLQQVDKMQYLGAQITVV